MNSQMLRRFNLVSKVILLFLVGCTPAWAQDGKKQSAARGDQVSTASVDGADRSVSGGAPTPAGLDPDYVIGPDDVLSIHVWKEPDISGKMPVRSDGKITVPLVGDIQASGLTPARLQLLITQRLSDFITNPQVFVAVEQMNSRQFTVMGEVLHPGSFPLTHTTRVMDALAIAGGFRDFAKLKKIHIMRRATEGGTQTIPFNYREVVQGHKLAQNIELQAGDTVVVP
jgi:polysaccharide biosynthesis/export protein